MEEVVVSQHEALGARELEAAPVRRGAVHKPDASPQRPLLAPSGPPPQSASADERDGLLREAAAALVMKPRALHDPVSNGFVLHGLGLLVV